MNKHLHALEKRYLAPQCNTHIIGFARSDKPKYKGCSKKRLLNSSTAHEITHFLLATPYVASMDEEAKIESPKMLQFV